MIFFKIKIFSSESRHKFKHFLSIVACVKNEKPYLKEWIEFHKLVGVEKFYIYDNESSDSPLEVLKPYIDEGVVDYIKFSGKGVQVQMYKEAIKKYAWDTKWMLIIDLDEFAVPIATNTLTEFFEQTPKGVNQLRIAWKLYGSNGENKKTEGLVIERFKTRASEAIADGPNYKSLVNPRAVIIPDVHAHKVFGKTVEENFKNVRDFDNMRPPKNRIAINHYIIKSREEFKERSLAGNATFVSKARENNWKNIFDFRDARSNEVYDPMPEKFVSAVKRNLIKK